jgi:hypothetical protein
MDLDSAVAFFDAFLDAEYAALVALYSEPDDAVLAGLVAAAQRYLSSSPEARMAVGLNRAPGVSARQLEEDAKLLGQLRRRALFQVVEFEHPSLGALFGAYASSQDAYTIGAYERLFYAAGLDTPKIIAAYVPELLAPAPPVTWRRLQGMEIDRPGRPVAVRRLTEPTRKAHRQDWNTTLP